MIISAGLRLFLLCLVVILPVLADFVATSSDYSLRGLMRPIIACLQASVVVILARTKNPIIDGDPAPVKIVSDKSDPPIKTIVTNPASNPVKTEEQT